MSFSKPSRLQIEPAATFRTTTSNGKISTALTSCSVSEICSTKWLSTPFVAIFQIFLM